jgi:hypothetical protein
VLHNSSADLDPVDKIENVKGCTAVAVFTGTRSNIADMLEWNGAAFKKAQEVLKNHGFSAHVSAHYTHGFFENCQTSLPGVLPCQPGIAIWFNSSVGYSDFLKDLSNQLTSVKGGFTLTAISRPAWDIYLNAKTNYCNANNPHSQNPITAGSLESTGGPYSLDQIDGLAASHRQLLSAIGSHFQLSFADGANFFVNNLPSTTRWYPHTNHDSLTDDLPGELELSVHATAYSHVYVQDFSTNLWIDADSENGQSKMTLKNRCDSEASEPFHMDGDGFVRNDGNGKLHYVFQYEALGGGLYGTTHPLACSANWHLPTIRELAKWAQASGAKGILETAQVPSGQAPSGYQLVNAKNLADGAKDDFYYNNSGYVPPAGDMGHVWFGTSSILSLYGGEAFVFHGVNAAIANAEADHNTSAIRCFSK